MSIDSSTCTSISFSFDSLLIASVDASIINIWNISTGQLINRISTGDDVDIISYSGLIHDDIDKILIKYLKEQDQINQ